MGLFLQEHRSHARVGRLSEQGSAGQLNRGVACLPGLCLTLALVLPASAGGSLRTGEEVPVTSNFAPQPRGHNSPALAVDPTDARFVAAAYRVDGPDFDCGLAVSGDGGNGWIPARPVPRLPEGAEKCYAPEVAFDGDGVLHYLFVGLHTRGNTPMGVFITTSGDRGRTFTAPRRVLGPDNFAVRMVIDPSRRRLHLVWIRANAPPGLGAFPPPPNPIVESHSDNGGRTFTKPRRVSDPGRDFVAAPAVALDRQGELHVLYYDLRDDARDYFGLEGPVWEGTWSLVHSSSRGEAPFRRGVVLEPAVAPPDRVMLIFTMPPAALAVGSEGKLFAAWHDARYGDWDVFSRASKDSGRSWAPPVRVNDDASRNRRHQYFPALAIGQEGGINAIFYDRREDPSNLRNHVYFASSADGGRTFSPNTKITTGASDSRIGARYGGPAAQGLVELGSRIGLRPLENGLIGAWADTRNALVPPHQDIFSMKLQFNDPAATLPSGFPVVGAVSILVGSYAFLRWRRSRRGMPQP